MVTKIEESWRIRFDVDMNVDVVDRILPGEEKNVKLLPREFETH